MSWFSMFLKNLSGKLVTIVLVSLFTNYGWVYSVDIDSAKETRCFPIQKTVPINETWVSSVKTWYYPLMSRLELYITSVGVSKIRVAEDLSEGDVYYNGCMKFQISQNKLKAKGFSGNEIEYEIKPIKGLEVFQFLTQDDTGGRGYQSAVSYTTFTDNRTFVFFASCLDDNQMTWGVMSPYRRLPTETVTLIHKHAESLGFNKQFFTQMQYNFCE